MNDVQIIESLKMYASFNINLLAKRDSKLRPVNDIVQKKVGSMIRSEKPISDKEAGQLTKWQQQDVIGGPFDDNLVQACHDIGVMLLNVASDAESNNKHMCLAAKYLHPLFSQDDRTVAIGWDLEEYMGWYFKDTTHVERKKYAKGLIENWRISDLRSGNN